MPNSQTNTPKVTSAAEWRKPAQGFVVELPSGKYAKVRRTLDFFDIIKKGEIPNPLKGIVMEAFETGDVSKFQNNLDENTLAGMLEFVDDCVCRMMLEPQVVKPPTKEEIDKQRHEEEKRPLTDDEYDDFVEEWVPDDENAISLTMIDIEDRMFLFQLAQGGTTDIAQFRAQSASNVGSVPASPGVPKPTKRTGGTAKRR